MGRILAFLYGVVAYAAFFGTIVYAIGFVGDLLVPKTIDDGVAGPIGPAILVNVLLLAAFAVQHTIMARSGFKRWWTRFVPRPIERSTFVLIASAILCVTFWQWRPMTAVVWHVDSPVARAAIMAVSLAGWAIVFYSSFLIDHFDLFGLRQVFLHLRGREYRHGPVVVRSLYRWVRHPLMLGFLIAFWAAPTMTAGHLLFAAVTTAYILVGTRIEERDLVRLLGDDYRRYRERTPLLIPRPMRRPDASSQPSPSS